VQLEKVQLFGSNLAINPKLYDLASTPNAISLGFALQVVGLDYDAALGTVGGLFNWRVTAHDKKQGEQVLHLSADYLVQFTGLGDHPRDQVLPFVDRLAEFASYPYFRSLVSQFSWAAELALPILPIIAAGRRAPRIPPPAPEQIAAVASGRSSGATPPGGVVMRAPSKVLGSSHYQARNGQMYPVDGGLIVARPEDVEMLREAGFLPESEGPGI
jgi:hypothetical protein